MTILALDIGSSSVRALLYDEHGQRIDGVEGRRAITITTAADGTAVIDADEVLSATWAAIDEVAREGITAVAVSTFAGSVVGVDGVGQPVTPLITYADTRAAGYLGGFDAADIHQRAGCPLHAAYLPARFRWMAAEHPDWLRQATRWLSLGAYLTHVLFGEAAESLSVASWNGLLNRHTLAWDADLLDQLPITTDALPPLVDVSDAQRGLRPPFTARWPALADVPWFPAVGDGAAANIGSGCTTPARIAVTVGTTSAARLMLPGTPERIPEGLWCYRVDAEHALLGGALSEGGNIYRWAQRTLTLPDDVETALAAMEPAAHGLTFLPLLAGERSPGYNAAMRGAIDGLSLATTPVEILRSAMEGVAYRLRLVVADLPTEEAAVVASGGALHASAVWAQIIADVLERPVTLTAGGEATSRGVVLLALRSLGRRDTLDASIDGQQIEPHPHPAYREAAAQQRQLYEMRGGHNNMSLV